MIDSFLRIYFETIAKVLRGLKISIGPAEVSFSFEQEEAEQTLDQRISKLDAARTNLLDGITAIEELKKEAQKNKSEIAETTQTLLQLQKDKKIVTSDIEAFRRVAGIPNEASIRRERLIGFISGIVASVLASGVVAVIVWLFHHYKSGT